jgi:hypothetical protein
VNIENKYYNAKQLKADEPEVAIDEFLGVPALEEEKSDWYGTIQDSVSKRLLNLWQGLQRLKAGDQAGI